MFYLSDIITYVRRIIKTPSDAVITDSLIIDYINRFYISDMDARIQLFDLKTKYQFQTVAGWDRYNMPLYNVQEEPGQDIGLYPVYQGFIQPAFISGIQVPLSTIKHSFYDLWPNVLQYQNAVGVGNGTAGPYTINLSVAPNNSLPVNPPINGIIRGHIDLQGIILSQQNVDPPVATNANFVETLALFPSTSIDSSVFITATRSDGSNIVVQDSGIFLESNMNYGMLMVPGAAPDGNAALSAGYSTTLNTVNYLNATATITFNEVIPAGSDINVQYLYFPSGLPRGLLFYNNTIVVRSVPSQAYLVELEAYLSPAAFLNSSSSVPFGYMAEYLARGAARKILSDVGDVEQFLFYEPLFKEQELLVWKRSQRQWTNNRTQTVYSQGFGAGYGTANSTLGGSQI